MERTDAPLSSLLAVTLLAVCQLAVAQDFTRKPKSPTPDELPGKQLIVWSETQTPHPLPASSSDMYATTVRVQMLSGTILARNSELFFSGADRVAFRIANQGQVREFAGKKVRVGGNLDVHAQILRVWNIEELK